MEEQSNVSVAMHGYGNVLVLDNGHEVIATMNDDQECLDLMVRRGGGFLAHKHCLHFNNATSFNRDIHHYLLVREYNAVKKRNRFLQVIMTKL